MNSACTGVPYTAGMFRLRQIANGLSPMERLDYRVLVVFCLASTLVLTPVAVNYFRLEMISVSLGIGGLAVGYALLGLWINHVGRPFPYNLLLAFVATAATLLPVHVLGAAAAIWIHPLILVNYYLLRRKVALGVNLFACTVLLLLLSREAGWTQVSHQATVLAAVMFFAHVFVWAIDRQQEELKRLSRRDAMTGLGNRRALDHAMQRTAARCQRSGLPLSIIILDLDKFKRVNDVYGHTRGDSVIRSAAEMITSRLRTGDRVFRYGGEEFVILCEDTDREGAQELAERLRCAAERELVTGELQITLSAGVDSMRDAESAGNCLERADQALLAAKSDGRNRVYLGKAPAAADANA